MIRGVSVALAVCLATGCGGEAPSGPAPLPTPSSGPAVTPPVNISLLAHVTLPDLVSRVINPPAVPADGNLSAAGYPVYWIFRRR